MIASFEKGGGQLQSNWSEDLTKQPHQPESNMKLTCPAKINLFLKVVGVTPNGYHELESLFAFLDLHDELEVNLSNKFNLEITGEFAQLIDLENNLFTKILDFFAQEFSISKNLNIKLSKNIPVGAGLGGGSSDAASFIKALNEIFELNLGKKDLQKIGLTFGADIPFFFENHAAIVRGIGEEISEFHYFEKIPALLIYPQIHLLTKNVFKSFDKIFATKISDEELRKKTVFDLIDFSNCLTKPAIAMASKIEEILSELNNLDANYAKMSGSGSSCFGIFSSDLDLENAQVNMKKKFPTFFIRKINILSNV
jgi:4-diphosphocytidyl-2-C-methyl-D-erythritol kinase